MTDSTSKHKPDQPDTPPETVDTLWQKLDLPPDALEAPRSRAGWWILLAVLLLLLGAGMGYTFWLRPTVQQSLSSSAHAPDLEQARLPTLLLTPTPTPTLPVRTPLPGGVPLTGQVDSATLPPTATPEGEIVVTPAARAVGWAASVDGAGHFNDPNIHVGLLQGHIYHGAIQFDLSAIPPNARLTSASLELTGLSDQNLASGGVWQVRLLDEAINQAWPVLNYDLLHSAEVDINILPGLTSDALGRGIINTFTFGPEQLAVLQQHLANGAVSFRLDGPQSGQDNFFTWDSGYRGDEEIDTKPALRIKTVSREYVVITSTPTPENVFTAVAMLDPTAQLSETLHTPTPLPPHWVTPVVVTSQPEPANTATAAYQSQLATVAAQVYGTPTPTPLNIWTATPTPSGHVVTSTPTPENIVTEAARLALATQSAQTIGTYTPVPKNLITPVVVTPVPAPANAATAEFYTAVATARAVVAGPEAVVWTATPTPIFGEPTVYPTFTPTPGYEPVPHALVGKIAFLSDRAGNPYETGVRPMVYVMDPGTGSVALLTNRSAYNMALIRDSFSADLRFRAYTEDFLRFDGQRVPGLYFHDDEYDATEQITQFGAGIAYDPAWSPAREQIAFVGTDTGDDEIWVVNRDGSGLRQLTNDPNWDKSPSWSPDGSRVIFWSNRTGQAQIWITNADGSNQYILHPSPYNDWNPVWIKYPGRPPLVPNATPSPPPVFIEFD